MRTRNALVVVVVLLSTAALAACGPERRGNGFITDSGPSPDAAAEDAGGLADASGEDAAVDTFVPLPDEGVAEDVPPPPPDEGPPPDATPSVTAVVYAHTVDELYAVHPTSLTVRLVGAFMWPRDGHDHRMTDIAVTGLGQIWGVTFNALYRVDANTAACTTVAALASGRMFNGLSFLPGASPGAPERLVGATETGEYFEIDTTTGAARMVGRYSGAYGSSGDIVSVAGAGTFATIREGPFSTEYLARVDDATGRTTIVGPTGLRNTWGLGYWGGTLYGFTSGGDIARIDVATGRGTVVPSTARDWWGAGVTTRASLTAM